jgi:hypothetical protein
MAFERPIRDPAIQKLAVLATFLGPLDRYDILFGGDGDLVRVETRDRQRDLEWYIFGRPPNLRPQAARQN